MKHCRTLHQRISCSRSYVALDRDALRQALNYFADGKIKGRAVRARRVR